jgi:hypothetical protein
MSEMCVNFLAQTSLQGMANRHIQSKQPNNRNEIILHGGVNVMAIRPREGW